MKSTIKTRSKTGLKPGRKTVALHPITNEHQSAKDPNLTTLSRASKVFFFTYSPVSRSLLSWSSNAKEVLGVPDSEIIREGNLFLRHVYPRDRFLILSNLESSLQGKEPYEATYRWIRPDTQEMRWLHCRAHLRKDLPNATFEGMIIDLSGFVNAQNSSGSGFSPGALLSSLHHVLFLFDSELRLTYHNGVLDQNQFNFGDTAFKHNEVKYGATLERAFSDPQRWERVKDALTTTIENATGENEIQFSEGPRTFRGTLVPILNDDDSVMVLLKVFDISDSMQLEDEIKKLSRAASYQVIAGGVIHNINNALQTIIGEASILLSNLTSPTLVRNSAEKIVRLSHRTADLTHELLDITSNVITQIDLNICTMTALSSLKEIHPKSTLEVSFGALEPCLGIQEKVTDTISQVLHYIWSEKEIVGTSIKTFLSPDFNTQSAILRIQVNYPNEFPIINTSTNIMDKLGVLCDNGGISLSCETIGTGSLCISISLPTVSTEQLLKSVLATDDSIPTVIIIDDDPMVGETLVSLLRNDGIHAHAFQNYHKAIELLNIHSNVIGLVFVDAIMPEIEGAALVKKLRLKFPDLPIIGFTGAPTKLKELREAGVSDVVLKPLDPVALKKLVFKYLNLQDEMVPLVGNS